MAITSVGNLGTVAVAPVAGPQATTPQAPAAAVSQQAAPTKQAVEQAVKEIKQAMTSMGNADLSFSIDTDTRQTVVRVVDSQTGDLIRQIPSQELIDIAKAMGRAQGLLLRQEA